MTNLIEWVVWTNKPLTVEQVKWLHEYYAKTYQAPPQALFGMVLLVLTGWFICWMCWFYIKNRVDK